jgi:hypothetical protein
MVRTPHLLLLLVVLILFGAACGDDDGADAEGPPSTTAPADDGATTTSGPVETTAAVATTEPTATTTVTDAPATTTAEGGNRGLSGLLGPGLVSGDVAADACVAQQVGPDTIARAESGDVDRETALALARAAETCGVSLDDVIVDVTPTQVACMIENIDDETYEVLSSDGDPSGAAMVDTIEALADCGIDFAELAGLEGVTTEEATCLFTTLSPETVEAMVAGGQPDAALFQELIAALQGCGIDAAAFVPDSFDGVDSDDVYCLFGALSPETLEELFDGQDPSSDALTEILRALVDCDIDPTALG